MEKKMLKRSLAVWMVLVLLFVCAAPVALMEGEEAAAPEVQETVSTDNNINEEANELLDENAEMLDNVTSEPAPAEEPAAEEVVEEVPAVEETPAVEEPAAEEVVVEKPAAEEVVEEVPAVEEPATEEVVVEEPAAEDVVEEVPAVEETPAEETPVVEEPAAEEVVVEEPAAEEVVEEVPAVEEPAAEEVVVEEPAAEEVVEEVPAVEETPVVEEPVAEEVVVEEPAAEEVVEEVPAVEETPVEETPVVEEPAAEEVVVEEPETTEPVMLYLDYEAHLYAGPSVQSEWLCYIPGPSEHVVIEYDGYWAKIEYYDSLNETLHTGYVYCLEEAPEIPDDAEHIATLEDALAPDCSIDIYVSWGDQEAAIGNTATLYASLNGYDNVIYYIQWQTSKDGSNWADIDGAMGYTLPVTVTEDNYMDYWRVVVTVTAVKE